MPIRFAYDAERARHASRWLLGRHGGKLDRVKLIKLIFLADRLHLSRYGRPIVGGRYCAMEHGPVPSEFYTEVKNGSLDGTAQDGHRVRAQWEADEDFLAESDLEVLQEINTAFGGMDTWRLRDLTHGNAWHKNYLGENSSYPLPYEDFFEDLAPETQEVLCLIREAQEAEEALG